MHGDLQHEEKITLTEAAKLAPGRPHASSLWRHCRKGCRARNGERIYLEHVRFGGRVFTTAEALDRFAHQLAQADVEGFAQADKIKATPTRPAKREQAIAAAERELSNAT